jgi:predicted transcriptional regulator of viral defense system
MFWYRFCSMSLDRSLRRLEGFGNRPFRVAEAIEAGVPRYELYRLRERGDAERVGRGVFRLADSAISSSTDLATVCARVPHGTICLNSALAYWDLTDELPAAVHVAVARGSHRPRIDYPAVRVHSFAAATFALERREESTETGERLWIYSPERSIVDAVRLAHQVGRDTALHSLTRYLRRADAQPLRLVALARDLGGRRRLTDALEVALS